MRRLLIDWILSRWLDEGRPLPRRFARAAPGSATLRRHAAGVADVDRALKETAGRQAAEPSPFLRTRILANLNSESAHAAPMRHRVWAPLALSVVCVGMLVGAFVLMKGTPGPVVNPPGPFALNDTRPLLPRASLLENLGRYQDQILRQRVDDQLKREADNLMADTQRAANVVLTRFPFKAVASR